MANVKGIVLLNAKRFVMDEFGPDAWDRVLAALSEEDRDVLGGAVSVGWYEIGVCDRMHVAIERVLGGSRPPPPSGGSLSRPSRPPGERKPTVMHRLGRYSAEHDLTVVHRLFFHLASPAYIMEKYGELWRRYQDTGTWSVDKESDTRFRAKLSGWKSTQEASCARLGAYVERMIELVVMDAVRVSRVRCRARGDEACELVIDWS